jgi:phenylpropionate dioxygenase-like ring-hydroxylating dioxygenase large terminal subunit
MTTALQSLPAWTYTSEEFFELERERLFLTSWQLVCHVSNIPKPGDYFTFDFLGKSAIVVRGAEDTIRAFHNVCRHRGSRILDDDSGHCGNRLTCPYHAWTYSLEGDLVGVPHKDDFIDFDPAKHRLKPIEMELFLGFIFLRFEGSGRSVSEMFAPYAGELAPYRFEDLKPLGRVTERARSVNWKNIADNYVDALHIPIAHPGLNALLGDSYAIEAKGDIHKMWGRVTPDRSGSASVRAYREMLPDMAHLPDPVKRQWVYYRMWPNLAFDIYPDQMDFMQFIPVSATETLIREIPYALPDDRRETKAARYLNWRINRQVNREDTDLVARVQKGMQTGHFHSGPFASKEILLIDSAKKMRETFPESLA